MLRIECGDALFEKIERIRTMAQVGIRVPSSRVVYLPPTIPYYLPPPSLSEATPPTYPILLPSP